MVDPPPPPAVVAPGVPAAGATSGAAPQPAAVQQSPDSFPASAAPAQLAPPALSPRLVSRFRTGRVIHVTGSIIGLLGNGLALTSIILTSVYGLDQSQDTSLTRLGPAMAYAGASANGAAFILSATGIGLQHSALAMIGKDPGRGLYTAGTVLGAVGLFGIGTSYVFRLSNVVDNAPTVAFGTSIAAAVLLTVSGVLYFADAARLESIYKRLTTF